MDGHDQRTCARRTEKVAELNDQFRKTGVGGKLMLTQAVASHGDLFVSALIKAVQQFDDFNADNDPWGEHDFGSVTISDHTFFWKIDVYDLNLEFGSPDPADETVSRRVLTLMASHDL